MPMWRLTFPLSFPLSLFQCSQASTYRSISMSPSCLLCWVIKFTLQGFHHWCLHHSANELPVYFPSVICFPVSLFLAVVLSVCLLSSPEVLITQADAARLRHCPAVIRWRSNKASRSIKVILIWCKSNMASLPVIPADTQSHRRKELLDPKNFVYLSSPLLTGEWLYGLFSEQHETLKHYWCGYVLI